MGLDIYAYKIKYAPQSVIEGINREDVFYLEEEDLQYVPEWVKKKFVVKGRTSTGDWEKSFKEYNKINGTSWNFSDFVFTGVTYSRKEYCYEFRKNDDSILLKLPERVLKTKVEDIDCFFHSEEWFYQRRGLENFWDLVWENPDEEDYERRVKTPFGNWPVVFDKATLEKFIPIKECKERWQKLLDTFVEGEDFVYFSY